MQILCGNTADFDFVWTLPGVICGAADLYGKQNSFHWQSRECFTVEMLFLLSRFLTFDAEYWHLKRVFLLASSMSKAEHTVGSLPSALGQKSTLLRRAVASCFISFNKGRVTSVVLVTSSQWKQGNLSPMTPLFLFHSQWLRRGNVWWAVRLWVPRKCNSVHGSSSLLIKLFVSLCLCCWWRNVSAYLVDEHLSTSRAHEQHGPPQSVPVPVELLGAHRVEEVSEDSADVAVHPLQGNIQTHPRRLVHKCLQTADVWRRRRNDRGWVIWGGDTNTNRQRPKE